MDTHMQEEGRGSSIIRETQIVTHIRTHTQRRGGERAETFIAAARLSAEYSCISTNIREETTLSDS